MTAFLDRALQREILVTLAGAYPSPIELDSLAATYGDSAVLKNLVYLKQLELIDAKVAELLGGPMRVVAPRINAKGLDFLQDDGGLSAVLNVVTVKLHADTIRDLLAQKVQSSNLPTTEKESLLTHLRTLPRTALEKATEHLVEAGIQAIPDVAQWLQTLAV